MGYFSQHLRNIKRKTVVQPKSIESGPIYEIRYKSKTATKSRYLVMALNIYPYTGSEKDKLLQQGYKWIDNPFENWDEDIEPYMKEKRLGYYVR